MDRIITILAILLITTTASAEYWVCQDTNEIWRVQGDCKSLGLCTGFDNQGLAPACINATKEEWDNAGLSNKKIDKTVVTGSRVIDMTQVEIDALITEKASKEMIAESQRLNLLDTKFSTLRQDINITKVDNAIDSISNLNQAKKFLKKLTRYILANQ